MRNVIKTKITTNTHRENFASKFSSGIETCFTVGTVRNTNLRSVGGMKGFGMLKPLSFER
jgi:hypothetical protein